MSQKIQMSRDIVFRVRFTRHVSKVPRRYGSRASLTAGPDDVGEAYPLFTASGIVVTA